jgi:hypothetical protein
MIQRKQSVFLLLAAIVLGLLYYFPLASFIGDKDSLVFYVYLVTSKVPDHVPDLPVYFVLPVLTLNTLIMLLTIVSIFLFRKRMLQLNLVRINLILLLVMIAGFFFYYVPALEDLSGGIVEYEMGAYFPLVAFIFYIMAYRGILFDEKLVRSADRLR